MSSHFQKKKEAGGNRMKLCSLVAQPLAAWAPCLNTPRTPHATGCPHAKIACTQRDPEQRRHTVPTRGGATAQQLQG